MAVQHAEKPRRTRTRRAKVLPWAELLRKIGEELAAQEGPGGEASGPDPKTMSQQERLARLLWARALDGDRHAIKLLVAYAYGVPVRSMAVAVTMQRPFTADEFGKASVRLLAWRAARLSETKE
ncbi:MAG TPA: hypothetical protein PLP66_14105 [Phycisphaerae bacterium]|nr:hypothetical protein [Phycisphaerae bacterium]